MFLSSRSYTSGPRCEKCYAYNYYLPVLSLLFFVIYSYNYCCVCFVIVVFAFLLLCLYCNWLTLSLVLSNKMPKRNTVLRRQAGKIIHNVVNYMQKEKDEGMQNVARVHQRAAEATGCSIRTVRNIIAEGKKTDMISVFRTPGKKRQKSRPITGIDNFDKGVIKRCIHNFHVAEKEMPTSTCFQLLAKLQRDLNFQGSVSSLSRIIKDLGGGEPKIIGKSS
ncbi:hypothetical protein PYW08_002956 [Mythimna loreyi]|uniref:Uncharacterized protein n=1 Tax=Mythimna loreyi TaxID=667449 RepID=A0ACC2QJX2_9NEOP|nr:hypothetical protein PYW08_002956 [Mythimna loreyi]